MSALRRHVRKIIDNNIDSYDNPQDFFNDLQQHGCVSGMISELVYHADTVLFFKKHNKEINELLVEALESTGSLCPVGLFGDKWDAEDPLALGVTNRNLLAWFAFEEVAYHIGEEWNN
jgi:hypothetical protein